MIIKKLKAFTLVELIIVITILAILATIAFVSFQNYVKDSRDSVRLTTLKNIESGLQAFQINVGNYPEPENYTLIQASGTTVAFQGYIGDTISKQIKVNKTPLDPFDQTKYIYSSNSQKTKYELLTHLENKNQLSYTTPTYASDYSIRTPKVLGDSIGILLDVANTPVSGNSIDILKANSGITYKAYFSNTVLSATGKDLLTTYSIANKDIAFLDASLVGYWDMENYIKDENGYSFKDFSSYNNHCNIGNNSISLVPGLRNQAYNLGTKSVNTWIQCGNGVRPEYNMTQFTLSMYLKRVDYGKGYYDGTSTDRWPEFFAFPNGHEGFSMRSHDYGDHINFEYGLPNPANLNKYDGVLYTATTGHMYKQNTWYYIVYTYDGTILKFYKNGVYISSYTISLNPSKNYPFYLVPGGYTFNGYMDEARIYNRALTDIEVSNLYNIK